MHEIANAIAKTSSCRRFPLMVRIASREASVSIAGISWRPTRCLISLLRLFLRGVEFFFFERQHVQIVNCWTGYKVLKRPTCGSFYWIKLALWFHIELIFEKNKLIEGSWCFVSFLKHLSGSIWTAFSDGYRINIIVLLSGAPIQTEGSMHFTKKRFRIFAAVYDEVQFYIRIQIQ